MKFGMSKIHGHNIYNGFDPSSHSLDLQGWGGRHPVFLRLIAQLRPSLIIEVGTWKGQSAIHMANALKNLGMTGSEIICVDTWLGSVTHWLNKDKPRGLQSRDFTFGYPNLYHQFLANVVLSNAEDMITPFPLTSLCAAQFLKRSNVMADLIYIDASHDYVSVKRDLLMYWNLLSPGGIMFGDDYTRDWPGVTRAVQEFAPLVGKRIMVYDEKWVLE